MQTKKTIFTAALAASLAAITPAAFPADAQIFGAPVCEAAQSVTYEKDGIKLLVPEIYDDLLYTKIFKKDKEGKEDEEGRLFSVTEAKSVVDAWLQNERESGPGWLFTIARVDADRLHQMLCGEMSGADVFAKDSKNRYFIFYHPTDVRFVRKDEDKMRRDQQLWTDLNEWASLDVQHEFFENNKGLVKERYDNSNVSMYLARAAYSVEPKVKYTVSTNQYGCPSAPRRGPAPAAPPRPLQDRPCRSRFPRRRCPRTGHRTAGTARPAGPCCHGCPRPGN